MMKKIVLITLILILINSITFAQEAYHGESETVVANAEKIVSTYHPANSLIFALQAHEKLVGISKGSDRVPLFRQIFPEMSDLPQVGSRHSGVNIEAVVSLDPDLILLPKTVEGKDYAQRFNDLGYDTMLLNLESLDDFYVNLIKLGEKLGKEERAENIVAKCKQMLNSVDAHLKNTEERPTCYYASQRSLLNTSTGELLQSVMLETAGGKNVAKELSGGSVTITKEQLLLWNPEHIFISYNSDIILESLAADPVYANLDAVKAGNVYKFPSDLSPWDYPSIEIFPAILWISTKIHPDVYKDVDFLEELNKFYEQIYGKSYTEFGGEL